jgi:hypothetical protein
MDGDWKNFCLKVILEKKINPPSIHSQNIERTWQNRQEKPERTA